MNWLHDPIKPMPAKLTEKVPTGDYLYEVKWDGTRAILVFKEDNLSIYTRNQNDVTDQFPELQDPPIDAINEAECCLFNSHKQAELFPDAIREYAPPKRWIDVTPRKETRPLNKKKRKRYEKITVPAWVKERRNRDTGSNL